MTTLNKEAIEEATIDAEVRLISDLVAKRRFSIHDEKTLQMELKVCLSGLQGFKSEHSLSNKDIIDFFWNGIGIEVKIKGGKKQIYKQLQRYTAHNSVKALILITSLTMGLPKEINGKSTYLIKLSKAWL